MIKTQISVNRFQNNDVAIGCNKLYEQLLKRRLLKNITRFCYFVKNKNMNRCLNIQDPKIRELGCGEKLRTCLD